MNVRNDFPILGKYPSLTYLDSACTSLKPRAVIAAQDEYYEEFGACAGRSAHSLARKTSGKIEECREGIAKFLGAKAGGLAFTKNATEGLNLVANSFDFSKRRQVITTILEHHSVLLPLMRLRDEGKIALEMLRPGGDGMVAIEEWELKIDRNTALVLTNNANNTTGIGHDANAICKIAHESGAAVCIDGAQGVPHRKTDFARSGFDFLCFSGHKMLGPTGIGAIAMGEEWVGKMRPFLLGGGTVKSVSEAKMEMLPSTERFEAGIQNYSGIFGLAAACGYLNKIGMGKVEEHEKKLASLLAGALEGVGAKILGNPRAQNHSALYSFNVAGAKPHDIALLLDRKDIAVRSGFFCAQPGLEALGARQGAVRASCYVYNSEQEVKRLGEALQEIGKLY
ncbi:aminotransferase class V-fold PLP-dependent enzyme [Candidatus Micrarchaeota archaeon]|nr:aminotransferase class V-fold PLP-dependent enzyme [Candidatus Micrarchaeota archaeon]